MSKGKKTSNPIDDLIEASHRYTPAGVFTGGRFKLPLPRYYELSPRDRRRMSVFFLVASALAAGGTVIAYRSGASYELIFPGAIAALFGFAWVMTYRSGRNKSSTNEGDGR